MLSLSESLKLSQVCLVCSMQDLRTTGWLVRFLAPQYLFPRTDNSNAKKIYPPLVLTIVSMTVAWESSQCLRKSNVHSSGEKLQDKCTVSNIITETM